jgi:hypothetical protein
MGSGIGASILNLVCPILGQFVGSNSQVLSLVVLVITAVMILLWLLNENKEGMIVWILRVGVAVALLINIFTLPQLLGMAPVCQGTSSGSTSSSSSL